MALNILLVEDDPGDVALVTEALASQRLASTLRSVPDGVEALRFLRREGRYGGEPRPDLILLDLDLPGMTGREVLTVVKSDDDLRLIPVVVFTTSAVDGDVLDSYAAHANACVTKPTDLLELERVMAKISSFYGELVARAVPPAHIARAGGTGP